MPLESSDHFHDGLRAADFVLIDNFSGLWPSLEFVPTPPLNFDAEADCARAGGSLTHAHGISHSIDLNTPNLGLGGWDGNVERMPRENKPDGVAVLKRWFDHRRDKPYPTKEEKKILADRSGLTLTQISTWFANTRRRRKNKMVSQNPLLSPSGRPIIKQPSEGKLSLMSPMERWRNSPPEAEAASFDAIMGAVVDSDFVQQDPCTRYSQQSTPSDARSAASSNASGSVISNTSVSSAQSIGSHSSAGSFTRFYATEAPRRRRRRKRATVFPKKPARRQDPRPYQCTFCTDTFRTKYDWTRHEKTLHLSLESYTCCPTGPTYIDQGETKRCSFCNYPDPSDAHIELHSYTRCQEKPEVLRTFYRKDHLVQHLRLVHGINQFQAAMEGWKSQVDQINSRCGLCDTSFNSWSSRNEHLAQHFKAGALMKDWKGSRGLDPSVAFAVENAMPPYLIGIESATPDPFSASNLPDSQLYPDSAQGHLPLLPSGAKRSPFNHFTVDLTNFVREAQVLNQPVTDAALQAAGRRILYDDEDLWNQSPADNPEWLQMFKRAVGLDCDQSTCPPPSVEDFDFFPSSADPWAVWNIFDAQLHSVNDVATGPGTPLSLSGQGCQGITASRQSCVENGPGDSAALLELTPTSLDELEHYCSVLIEGVCGE
ncbi:uncharacterized protein DSM5745_04440 [Aspergillus mulundensis]|uniref:Homeobox and C2H2 transcription factor n=1 Tax=Aspergillus mulundensis TaxID=1810919 RepID=A0A3D8SDE1_9EURO|nr:hypothetical protein DSM5745_04440 [Aspergillus mulundensis]RDW84114.1 hypothetical protein DSM5745_04440 [Aspergillus mulundensis]